MRLRTWMSRRRRRGAVLIVLLVLTSGVAVHHAAATTGHARHAVPAAPAHGDHAPAPSPAPASDVAEIVAVCLAVLPLVAALLLLGSARLRRQCFRRVALASVAVEMPRRPATRARAGPYDLCVMRC